MQFVLRNPHSFVHMEAPDEHGMTQRWAVEWAGTAQLGAQGVKRESLKVGDAITVTARPSRVPGGYGRSCSACGVRSTGSPGARARELLVSGAVGPVLLDRPDIAVERPICNGAACPSKGQALRLFVVVLILATLPCTRSAARAGRGAACRP